MGATVEVRHLDALVAEVQYLSHSMSRQMSFSRKMCEIRFPDIYIYIKVEEEREEDRSVEDSHIVTLTRG